ncbi:MAG: MFS transporter [Pyrinomonadaceae bacterium]|nr:MFS transporter [Pyrinomonadaceae bacterium]MBP6212613.1 MFS transporter [Pyrinomonadaceae bacterium]
MDTFSPEKMPEGPRLEMTSRRRWAVTIGVMTGMAIAALEATVVGTAMPTVIASLGGINHYSWVFSAYLVTSTVTVPVWGKLSDLYGRRLLYQVGIGVFLLGTLLSGLADSMTQLIVFRAIQGLGAGALVPLGMTIIGDIFTLKERAKMQAYFSGVWGLSSVIGPVIGGFITDQISWRWVFFVNLPVGVAAALIIGLALKEPKVRQKPTIDYAGAALLMIAISLVMLGLVEGGSSIRTIVSAENLGLFAGGAVLLAIFVWVETRASDPIIPFRMFRNRTVAVSVSAGFLAGIAMFGGISFIPLFAQGALGMTATQAGSLLTPLMLSWVLMSIVGGRLLLRLGYRNITIAGFIVMTTGFVLLSTFNRTTPQVWLYLDLILIGSGLGLTMLTLLIAVQQAVSREQLGVATSLSQFSRAIGGAFGVAIMGAVLTGGLAANLLEAAAVPNSGISVEQASVFAENPNALIEPQARAALPAETLKVLEDAMTAAVHPVFWFGAAVCVVALFLVLMLPRQVCISKEHEASADCGESMLMAEQTTINARNQPAAEDG